MYKYVENFALFRLILVIISHTEVESRPSKHKQNAHRMALMSDK